MEAGPGAWESSDVADEREGGVGVEEEGTGMALCQLQHAQGQRNVVLRHQEHAPAPKGAKALPPLQESTSQSVPLHGWPCTV